ncbi:MAG: phosphoribosylglycinamide formyltransferase, partial [Candidatus Obscuribacterales bacterium]|nr:phosphoribosylglycinamide formyltransferase [Candidatus Obscuribacterales bacterium]
KVVVSNDPQAQALKLAEQHGIPTVDISHKTIKRRDHEQKILDQLEQYQIDLVVLAGYMRVLSKHFLKAFEDPDGFFKVVNIHPSLLPSFPGINAYRDAFEYGVKVSGVTVHLVDEKVDHGPILAQEPFPRFPDDNLEVFSARGLSVEHALYPAVLDQIAKNGIKLPRRETVKK